MKKSKIVYSINCWEQDYRILADDYEYRVALNDYPFDEMWLIVLNVNDKEDVKRLFKGRGIKLFFADELEKEVLSFFKLTKDSFEDQYANGYKYSIASLIELYLAKDFDYICHFTSDVSLVRKGNWIREGIKEIESEFGECVAARPGFPVYESSKETERKIRKTQVFSDHCYLLPVKKFRSSLPFIQASPRVLGIHPLYGGESFERKITRLLLVCDYHEVVINSAEILHPCY